MVQNDVQVVKIISKKYCFRDSGLEIKGGGGFQFLALRFLRKTTLSIQ